MSDKKTNKGNKMSNRLVAICSMAIGVIYSSGYLVTELHAKEVEKANQQSMLTQSVTPSTIGKTFTDSNSVESTSRGFSHSKSKYHDGIYYG
jgi:hypothetical protein